MLKKTLLLIILILILYFKNDIIEGISKRTNKKYKQDIAKRQKYRKEMLEKASNNSKDEDKDKDKDGEENIDKKCIYIDKNKKFKINKKYKGTNPEENCKKCINLNVNKKNIKFNEIFKNNSCKKCYECIFGENKTNIKLGYTVSDNEDQDKCESLDKCYSDSVNESIKLINDKLINKIDTESFKNSSGEFYIPCIHNIKTNELKSDYKCIALKD